MDAIRMEVINQAARERAAATRGQQGQIIEQAARTLGLSVQRTHTLVSQTARALALDKPRKRRCDAGDTAVTDADLELISGVMVSSHRAGKWMLSAIDAIDMLFEADRLSTRLSPGRTLKLLRSRGLHPEQVRAPRPSVSMRTEHPNAVWQIDASVCVLYRTPKGELLLLEEDGVHYKNKLHNFTRVINDLLVRYVGTDHASGCIGARFYIGGETTENALNFLMWLMTPRTDTTGAPMPFHGVPWALYTDQGSAFKAGPFTNFCRAMSIEQLHHAPRNSQATGQVENAQNLFERGLESRLRFMDGADLTMDRLNSMAELWMRSYNGVRRHGRHGMARYGAWSLITPEQLRLSPALEIMRELPATMAKTRQVSDAMRVSFAFKGLGSREYDVRYVPGLSPRMQVFVTVNPLAFPAVRVGVTDTSTGEIVWHQVEPVQTDRFGFDVSAPVLGKSFRAMPATPADALRKQLAAQAYATPKGPATPEQADAAKRANKAAYLGQFDPLADMKAAQLPTWLPRKGTELAAVAPTVEPLRLSVAAACQRIRQALGEAYDPNTYTWMTERHGSAGVPEEAVTALIAAHQVPKLLAAPVALRAVGGGA